MCGEMGAKIAPPLSTDFSMYLDHAPFHQRPKLKRAWSR